MNQKQFKGFKIENDFRSILKNLNFTNPIITSEKNSLYKEKVFLILNKYLPTDFLRNLFLSVEDTISLRENMNMIGKLREELLTIPECHSVEAILLLTFALKEGYIKLWKKYPLYQTQENSISIIGQKRIFSVRHSTPTKEVSYESCDESSLILDKSLLSVKRDSKKELKKVDHCRNEKSFNKSHVNLNKSSLKSRTMPTMTFQGMNPMFPFYMRPPSTPQQNPLVQMRYPSYPMFSFPPMQSYYQTANSLACLNQNVFNPTFQPCVNNGKYITKRDYKQISCDGCHEKKDNKFKQTHLEQEHDTSLQMSLLESKRKVMNKEKESECMIQIKTEEGLPGRPGTPQNGPPKSESYIREQLLKIFKNQITEESLTCLKKLIPLQEEILSYIRQALIEKSISNNEMKYVPLYKKKTENKVIFLKIDNKNKKYSLIQKKISEDDNDAK